MSNCPICGNEMSRNGFLEKCHVCEKASDHYAAEIERLRARVAELESAESALVRHGFRKCDIAACNCGSWHHVGGLAERFNEIASDLSDAGHPLSNDNGHLVRRALASLVKDRDSWKAIAEDCHSTMNLIRHRGYDTKFSVSSSDLEALMRRIESARAASGEVGQ